MSERESEGSLFVVLSRIASELKELNANIKRLADVKENRGTFEQRRPRGERSTSRERRRGERYRGTRKMYKVTCSDCGKETEVPFKPTRERPVYCRDCLQKHRM